MQDRYTRIRWLLGNETIELFENIKILVFGLGGVGGVCVDTLYRTGFTNLTLIDCDKFEITNMNRQIHSQNLGQNKAEVFAKIYNVKGIVADINEKFLANFDMSDFDMIIDAIDDITAKINIVKKIDFNNQLFISSTGGARKLDPTKIQIAPLFKTHGDALAKKFRYELKKSGFKGDFDVVFSNEKAHCRDLGSFMGVTASFGLALASLALKKIIEKYKI